MVSSIHWTLRIQMLVLGMLNHNIYSLEKFCIKCDRVYHDIDEIMTKNIDGWFRFYCIDNAHSTVDQEIQILMLVARFIIITTYIITTNPHQTWILCSRLRGSSVGNGKVLKKRQSYCLFLDCALIFICLPVATCTCAKDILKHISPLKFTVTNALNNYAKSANTFM